MTRIIILIFCGIIHGFDANAITSPCNENFLGDAGPAVITSPNFPFDYYSNQDCIYRIHFQTYAPSDINRKVCFLFRRFHLQDGSASDCNATTGCAQNSCVDYLRIGSHKYCGTLGNRNDQLPNHTMDNLYSEKLCFPAPDISFELQFISDDQVEGTGFYAEFHITESSVTGYDVEPDAVSEMPNDGYNQIDDIVQPKDLSSDCNSSTSCLLYCYHGYKIDGQGCPICQCVLDDIVSAPCPFGYFTCFNRRCISEALMCDRVNDCGDLSDELYAHSRCYHDTGLDEHNVYGCTFESGQCGSTSTNWVRANDAVVGPMFDHTVGEVFGHLMHTEYKQDSHSRLSFPVNRSLSSGSPACLRFWYYMYDDVGSLRVEIQSDYFHPVIAWSREDDLGPLWFQGMVDLPMDERDISKITFHTSEGIDLESPIALDDISIVDGNCYGDDISCTFELGLCSWSNDVSNAAVNWKRFQGSTQSLDTGPSDDVSGGGSYVYVEASESAGSVSTLVSAPISNWSNVRVCLIYYYHMYGKDIGALKVYIRHVDGKESLIQDHYGNQGPDWKKAMTGISVLLPYQLVFKAVVGDGSLSDIAIDNIVLQNGHCPQSPNSVNPDDALGSTQSAFTCADTDFQCDGLRCLPSYYRCDRRIDCIDRSDEAGCNFEANAAVVALCAIGVCVLSIIVIAAILYNRRSVSASDDNRVSSVSEMMNAYRNRADMEATERDEFADLPPDISEPPPEYLSVSTDRIGQGALGPELTMALRFPPEQPPAYRKAIKTKAYMPSTIGPNPPPYTNVLPDGNFPVMENEAFVKDDDTDYSRSLTHQIAHPDEPGSSSTYIPTVHRHNSITSAALSPFRSLMRRGKLARSVRERNVMAQAIQPDDRPASYNETSCSLNNSMRQDDESNMFPRVSTFPRSAGMVSLNTIGFSNPNARPHTSTDGQIMHSRSPETTSGTLNRRNEPEAEAADQMLMYDNVALECNELQSQPSGSGTENVPLSPKQTRKTSTPKRY